MIKEENKFRERRKEIFNEAEGYEKPIPGIEPYVEYEPQHDMNQAFYDANKEIIKFANMKPSEDYVDARNIKSKNRMTLKDLRDIADNPSEPGKYAMQINGRVIDLNYLEEYVLQTNNFSMISKLKRYNSGIIYDDIRGYDRYLSSAKKHRGKK